MADENNIACPACGFVQDGGSIFCCKCGRPLQARAEPAAGPYAAPGAYPSALEYANTQPPKTSGMAIASLVCGCLGCIPISGLLAIIFGIIGIVQTKDGRKRGMGMAIAGLILGVVLGFLGVPLLISIMIPSLSRAREVANRVKCASNMRQIGQAILLYENQYQGQYPPDLATLLKTESIAPAVFLCPDSNDTPASGPGDLESGGHDSYVYLGKGLVQNGDPTIPVLYEVDAHHVDGANFLFADGHVEFFAKSQEAAVLSRANKPGGS